MSKQREKPEIYREVKSLETREHISPADSDRKVREYVLDMFSFGWLYNIQVYMLYGQEMKDEEKDKRKG